MSSQSVNGQRKGCGPGKASVMEVGLCYICASASARGLGECHAIDLIGRANGSGVKGEVSRVLICVCWVFGVMGPIFFFSFFFFFNSLTVERWG